MARFTAATTLLAVLLGVVGSSLAQQPQRFETRSETGEYEQSEMPPPPEFAISDDVEIFRIQLLDFVGDLETAVLQVLEHPAMAEQLYSRLGERPIQLPLPPEYRDMILLAEPEDLALMHEAFKQTPQILSVPVTLSAVLAELSAVDLSRDARLSCSDNYSEWRNVLSKRSTRKDLMRARNSIKLSRIFLRSLAESLRAVLEDVPIIGSKPSIPEFVIWGIAAAAEAALDIAVNEMSISIEESELCIAACLKDGDISGEDSKLYRGKGCDNRDNNCRDGIDEKYEDNFSPVISVDPELVAVCYADQAAALEAAERAIVAEDDCALESFSVNVIPQPCYGMVQAVAQDGNPMTVPVNFETEVVIDGEPPIISPPQLAACYDTLADARAAMAATTVTDFCSSEIETSVDILEKECLADLALEAIDECGNRSVMEARTLVDGTPPHVRIENLMIPSINGLTCFATRSAAVATVAEATFIVDNCTPVEELIFDTSTDGDLCDLEITSGATDECQHASSDSLVVRVDDQPPVIACSVGQSILWPPDNRMVDIGLVLDVWDNCDGRYPHLDVMVTSDEPTRFAYLTANEPSEDPRPDAVVNWAPDGSLAGIQLRAQRRQTGGYDGRVYRIRVTATDSCGLSSETECWVTVPPTPGQGTAVNSGQIHDATLEN